MGLVRNITERVEIPGDAGQWAVIKKLPWGLLEAAEKARTKSIMSEARDMPPELLLREVSPEEAERARQNSVARELLDPTAKYDHEYLLRHAVAEWSYEAALPEGVMELDRETKQFLVGRIVAFNEGKRSDAERLDATSPSTSP